MFGPITILPLSPLFLFPRSSIHSHARARARSAGKSLSSYAGKSFLSRLHKLHLLTNDSIPFLPCLPRSSLFPIFSNAAPAGGKTDRSLFQREKARSNAAQNNAQHRIKMHCALSPPVTAVAASAFRVFHLRPLEPRGTWGAGRTDDHSPPSPAYKIRKKREPKRDMTRSVTRRRRGRKGTGERGSRRETEHRHSARAERVKRKGQRRRRPATAITYRCTLTNVGRGGGWGRTEGGRRKSFNTCALTPGGALYFHELIVEARETQLFAGHVLPDVFRARELIRPGDYAPHFIMRPVCSPRARNAARESK